MVEWKKKQLALNPTDTHKYMSVVIVFPIIGPLIYPFISLFNQQTPTNLLFYWDTQLNKEKTEISQDGQVAWKYIFEACIKCWFFSPILYFLPLWILKYLQPVTIQSNAWNSENPQSFWVARLMCWASPVTVPGCASLSWRAELARCPVHWPTPTLSGALG